MYAELNTKSDYCQKCGYTGEILIDDNLEWYCPNCGNRDHRTLNVARRTCGYIGTNFWNKGRTQEIKERVLHIDNKDFDAEKCTKCDEEANVVSKCCNDSNESTECNKNVEKHEKKTRAKVSAKEKAMASVHA